MRDAKIILFGMLGYTWQTRGKIFLVNAIVIGIFGMIGYGLDYVFHKKAFFIFILILISFPLPTIIIRRMVKREREMKESSVSPEAKELDTMSVKEYLK